MIAEQEGDRERPSQPRQDSRDGVLGRGAALDLASNQVTDNFRIRLALERPAIGDELVTQRLEILDDAVVDQRNRPDDVRMGVPDRGRAMGRPPGMRDPGDAVERIVGQFTRQIVELAFGAAPLELAIVDGADPRRVIAAVFEALEPVEQPLRDVAPADESDNSTQALFRGLPRHPLAETFRPAGETLLLAALDR